MVNEKMAIMTEPRKVISGIIQSITIFVVDSQNSRVRSLAYLANFLPLCSIERCNRSGARMPILPTLVIRSEEDLISPNRLA